MNSIDPNTIQAAAAATTVTAAVSSPFVGSYTVILICAIGGVLWTISSDDQMKPMAAAKLFFRAVLLSVLFTSFVAHYVSKWIDYPAEKLFGMVSFFLAWVGDRWAGIRDRLLQMILSWKKS